MTTTNDQATAVASLLCLNNSRSTYPIENATTRLSGETEGEEQASTVLPSPDENDVIPASSSTIQQPNTNGK